MKKSLLALAAMVMAGAAFATDVSTAVSTSGNAKVSGAINNNIAATAVVNGGPGSSFSAAWSGASATASASSNGLATITTNGNNCSPLVTGANVIGNISGSTATDVYGGAYNTSSGTGTGSATANGWADAGSSASFGAILPSGMGGVSTTGLVNTGHPSTSFGPDINVSAGPNQAVSAEGNAGGQFNSQVTLVTSNKSGVVSGTVSDEKGTSNYANTVSYFGTSVNKDFVTGTAAGTVNVLNASSTSAVNAAGNFLVNTEVANVK